MEFQFYSEMTKQNPKILITKIPTLKQTRLIAIGNSYGIQKQKAIIHQFYLQKKNIEISL